MRVKFQVRVKLKGGLNLRGYGTFMIFTYRNLASLTRPRILPALEI